MIGWFIFAFILLWVIAVLMYVLVFKMPVVLKKARMECVLRKHLGLKAESQWMCLIYIFLNISVIGSIKKIATMDEEGFKKLEKQLGLDTDSKSK